MANLPYQLASWVTYLLENCTPALGLVVQADVGALVFSVKMHPEDYTPMPERGSWQPGI